MGWAVVPLVSGFFGSFRLKLGWAEVPLGRAVVPLIGGSTAWRAVVPLVSGLFADRTGARFWGGNG